MREPCAQRPHTGLQNLRHGDQGQEIPGGRQKPLAPGRGMGHAADVQLGHIAHIDDAEAEPRTAGHGAIQQRRSLHRGEVIGARTGPRTTTGLTTDSSSEPLSYAMNLHAARSASVLDFTYADTGLRWVDQFDSVNGVLRLVPVPMAANEEVSTTRLTPASRAARRTRSVPSRAGTISSSSCFGALVGRGDAMCST